MTCSWHIAWDASLSLVYNTDYIVSIFFLSDKKRYLVGVTIKKQLNVWNSGKSNVGIRSFQKNILLFSFECNNIVLNY